MSGTGLWGRVRSGEWLDQQIFPSLRYAVPGIIPEGCGLVVAPPKAGKSWFALNILLDIARGAPTLGGIDVGPARPVFYLALEDGDRRLQSRARTLLGSGPIPKNFDYLTKAKPDEIVGLISEWLARFGDDSPLVVLDTLGKIMPPTKPGESAYQRDYRVVSALKSLADEHPGSTVLLVHHTRKMVTEDFMDSVSGTHGINGAGDFTLALSRVRNSDQGELKVAGRDVEEREYALTMTGGRWAVTGGDLKAAQATLEINREASVLSDMTRQVLAAVRAAPGGSISPKEVAEAVPGLGNDEASSYLARQVRANRITRVGRGRYAAVQEVSEVFGAFEGVDDSGLTPTVIEPGESVSSGVRSRSSRTSSSGKRRLRRPHANKSSGMATSDTSNSPYTPYSRESGKEYS